MAQATLRSRGDTRDYTAGSTINAGDVVVVGSIPMVAVTAIASGSTGSLHTTGIFQVVKDTSTFADGDAVYWKPAGDPVSGTAGTGACSSSPTGAKLMGTAVAAAVSGASYVTVRLSAAERTTTIAGSVTADDITGSDASLTVAGLAGSGGSAGGAVSVVGGAGHTNGAGGATSRTGGAGAGSGAGGASTSTGGVGGPTGAGGAASVTGGAGGSTSGTGGAASVKGGAGSAGNANGGAASIEGGAKNGSGTDGAVNIGMNNTSAINMGILPRIPTATVAATGSVQGDAAAVAEGKLTLVTAADATKGVVLPSAVAGMQVIIKNADAANAILKIYPAASDAINALSANAAFSIAAKTSVWLIAYDATTWYSVPLLPS